MCKKSNEQLVAEFIEAITFGRELNKKASRTKEKVIMACVKKAYGDIQRVLWGISKHNKLVENAEIKLSKVFQDYFDSEVKDMAAFDKWHNEQCEMLLKKFEDFKRVRDDKVMGPFSYGIAQKWINMTFKYLYVYTLGDIIFKMPNIDDYFEFCHMALDTDILKWCNRNNIDVKDRKDKKKIVNWSNITDYNFYKTIQDEIRIRQKGKKPFIEEFDIWSGNEDKEKSLNCNGYYVIRAITCYY